jgi:hypothetical protein
MDDKRSRSDQDAGLPRTPWWKRPLKKLGLQRDAKSDPSSLPDRNHSHQKYSHSEGHDSGSKRVQVQTIEVSSAQVEPGPQAGSHSASHEGATDAEQRAKLQDKNEKTSPAEERAADPTGQKTDSKRDDRNADIEGISTREPEDFWALADEQLRQPGSDGAKIMKKFDLILEKPENLGSTLEPPGTDARKEQISAFLQSRIKKLKEPQDQSRWSQCGKDAKTFFKKAVGFVIATQGIMNAAAAPCLPASVACAGVTLILTVKLVVQRDSQIGTDFYQICLEAVNSRQDLFAGLDAISHSIHHIAQYEDLLCKRKNQIDDEIKGHMTTVCRHILEFEARAIYRLDKNSLAGSADDLLAGNRWKTILSNIHDAELQINDYAQTKSFGDILDIYPRLDALENSILDAMAQGFSDVKSEIQALLKRHSKAKLEFLELLYGYACPYKESKDRVPERVDGTCNWFTNHPLFKNWNTSTPEATDLLYVSADPGCGKSVLSKYLIDEVLPQDQRTICYFFFKDDFENQKSAPRAICTFLYQVFMSHEELLTDDVLRKQGARGKGSSKIFPSCGTCSLKLQAAKKPFAFSTPSMSVQQKI